MMVGGRTVSWILTTFDPKHEGRNVGIHLQHCTSPQPRRLQWG